MSPRPRRWLPVFIFGFGAGAFVDRLWVTDRLHELPGFLIVIAGALFPVAVAFGVMMWTTKR